MAPSSMPQAPAAWPSSMARYERLERLGAGINGEVFKAWDTQEEEIVAVKRLSATGNNGLIVSDLQEVLRERRCLRSCDGVPSVVQFRSLVVPASKTDDSFIVMDYAGRLNLRTYILRRACLHRPFSESEVRRIMRQILEAVRSVNEKGILHLDIRPENVILDDGTEDMKQRPVEEASTIPEDGKKLKEDSLVCKIGGFGMSRLTEQGETTRPEVVFLTPYSAPELLLRSRQYDDRVDTWGLGCIMADLLSGTGTPTFDGESDSQIICKVDAIVGAKGVKDWSGYSGIAAQWKSSKLTGAENHRRLRRKFPGGRLSSAGFEVLSGLLECNPEKRLTAEEALEKPWFHKWRRGFGACFR